MGKLREYVKRVSPDFEITKEHQKIFYFLIDGLILGESPKKNTILHGPVGSGKTLVLKIIMNFLHDYRIFDRNYNPVLISSYNLQKEFRSHPESERENLLNRISGSKYLALDDIGSEDELVIYGSRRNLIKEVLHDRYDLYFTRGARTFMTTNLDLKGLRDHYGERIFSRLMEISEWDRTGLTANDRRLSNSTANVDFKVLREFKLSSALSQ